MCRIGPGVSVLPVGSQSRGAGLVGCRLGDRFGERLERFAGAFTDERATETLHDRGQSLWLDNITRDLLETRHARALHRRALGDRAHVQPDDLRPRHQEQLGLRRRHPEEGQGRQVGRGAVLRAGARGPDRAPRICSDRSGTGRAAWTAGCRSRCRRCWPTTPPAPWPPPRRCTPARGDRTSSSRSPAPRKGCRPSRRRSSPASRST